MTEEKCEVCSPSEHYSDELERFQAVEHLFKASKILLESADESNNKFGDMLYDLTKSLFKTIPMPDSINSILAQQVTNENISDSELDDLINEFLSK